MCTRFLAILPSGTLRRTEADVREGVRTHAGPEADVSEGVVPTPD
jgi:hypothetical protein